jgi:hypothetical protein
LFFEEPDERGNEIVDGVRSGPVRVGIDSINRLPLVVDDNLLF